MEDDGDHTKDDNFYPSDFDDDFNELEEFFQGVHERNNTNIGILTFQETWWKVLKI